MKLLGEVAGEKFGVEADDPKQAIEAWIKLYKYLSDDDSVEADGRVLGFIVPDEED